MASQMYDYGRKTVNQRGDWVVGNYNVLLVDSAYSIDVAAHKFVSDVVGHEISTTNYARQALASKTSTVDTTAHKCHFGANNNTWSALGTSTGGPTAAGAIIYWEPSSSPTDATRELVAFIDFPDQTLAGVNFTIEWNSGASSGTIFDL